MSRAYRKDAECEWCIEMAPLLLPVRVHVAYGGDDVFTVLMCSGCRLGFGNYDCAMLALPVKKEG